MGTRRTEKACATRRQLLDAALEVIGEKGYSAATVDEIEEAAGVSKGVAYYHFKSKAAMAESILEDGIGRIVAGFECIAAEAPTAADALTGMIELFASGIFENKAFGRFFVSELWREGRVWSDAMRGYERRLLDVLEGQIARGQREGCIRPEIDPAFEAVALVGMVLTGALYHLGDEGPLTREPLGQRAGALGAPGETGETGVSEETEPEGGALRGGAPGEAGSDADGLRGCAAGEAESDSGGLRGCAAGGKEAFIARIVDFVRHANARPGALG